MSLTHRLIFTALFLSASLFMACLELTSAPPAPCGGLTSCSAPRVCLDGQCVASCYSDDECERAERCERQLCVPVAVVEELMSGAQAGAEAGAQAGAEAGAQAGAEAGAQAGAEAGVSAGSAG